MIIPGKINTKYTSPKFHHFGYATYDIKVTEDFFKELGFIEDSDLIKDDLLGVFIKFYKFDKSEIKLELVAPIDVLNSPIKSVLSRRPGLYHLAFLSSNFAQTAKKCSLSAITESKPAVAFDGRHVQFFVSKDSSIIELIYGKD